VEIKELKEAMRDLVVTDQMLLCLKERLQKQAIENELAERRNASKELMDRTYSI